MHCSASHPKHARGLAVNCVITIRSGAGVDANVKSDEGSGHAGENAHADECQQDDAKCPVTVEGVS